MGAIEMMGPGKMGRVMIDTAKIGKALNKGHKFTKKKDEAAYKKDLEIKSKKDAADAKKGK